MRWYNRARDWVVPVTIGAAVLVSAFCRVVTVTGGSMLPTLLPGDKVLLFRTDLPPVTVVRRFLTRGQIVVVSDPIRTRRAVVKRIGAVGGDRVAVSGTTVHLTERRFERGAMIDPSDPNSGLGAVTDVPEGHYYLIADNADFGVDSRVYGAVNRDSILGVVLFRSGQRSSTNDHPGPSSQGR